MGTVGAPRLAQRPGIGQSAPTSLPSLPCAATRPASSRFLTQTGPSAPGLAPLRRALFTHLVTPLVSWDQKAAIPPQRRPPDLARWVRGIHLLSYVSIQQQNWEPSLRGGPRLLGGGGVRVNTKRIHRILNEVVAGNTCLAGSEGDLGTGKD